MNSASWVVLLPEAAGGTKARIMEGSITWRQWCRGAVELYASHSLADGVAPPGVVAAGRAPAGVAAGKAAAASADAS